MGAGFHITWGKAGVIFAALAVFQGMGYFTQHREPNLVERVAAIEAKMEGMDKHLQTIETCLLTGTCGQRK
jgi:hypothetical protein